jgi:PAS domain S-box-containing protein
MTAAPKINRSGADRAPRWPGYVVAVLSTFVTLGVRLAMDSTLGGRPTLVIFTIPIMLSAYVGGLGPGLFATLLSYLAASYYLLPPIDSFHVTSAAERWQQAFVAFAGVVISVLNEALHRTRRRADLATAEHRRAESASVQLAAIVESSDDAIISKDFNGIVISWNSGAERIFGYAAGEMVGISITRLIPADRQEEEDHILGQIRKGERVRHFETVRQTKDGRLLNVSVTVSPIRDAAGKVTGASKIVRDITVEKAHEREIARLSRLYAALSQVNQAIVMTHERDELFARICRALVEQGGFRMAWIGLLDPVTRRVQVASQWGDVMNYVGQTTFRADDEPEGRGPTGTAIREGRTYVCNDFARDPLTGPWREAAERAGYRSSAVLPIRQDGRVCGSINVYADETGFFQDREIALLEEAAGDISFGLNNLARDALRREAEQGLRASEERLQLVTDNARVGLVMIDRDRRYSFANATYAEILGLASPEIIGLRVADVLAPLYEQIRPRLDRAFAGERVAYELSRPAAVGTHYYTVRYEPTKVNGAVVRVVAVVTDITDRKQAEEARHASEAQYRTLFDYAPDGIVIADAESYYIDANASACRMLGYTREELIRLHARDIVVQAETRHIAPALGAIKAGADYHREWKFRRKDGSVFAAEVIATMMPGGNLLGMIRDVTERNQAQASLRDSEERFRQLTESIDEVFWLTDPAKNTMLYISPAYEKIWGRTCQSLYQTPLQWAEALYSEDRDRVLAATKDKQAQGDYDETFRIIRPDGSLRWIHDRAFPVRDASGTVFRIAGVAQDITEKKQLESHFFRAQRLESIGTLASGIAHDLNNILAPIMMAAPIIRMSKSPAATEKMLATVESSAQRGAQLVRQLLTFGRGAEGERKMLAIAPIFGEMVAIAQQTFPKNITIATEIAADVGPILGDATQVHQVLLNLCVNARDAMPQGGKLTLAAANLQVGRDSAAMAPGAKAGDYVRISVADTGSGMTPEIIDKIFDPFFTTKEIGKGTGLGLATVLGLVKSHGGFVTLNSEPGAGSVFHVHFPASCRPESSVPVVRTVAPPPGQGELLLVVDDEENIRDVVSGTLSQHGYRVITADDGIKGTSRYAMSLDEIKLVITDLDMPNLDGVTMIRVLRQMNPRLKVIVSSGILSREQMDARMTELTSLGVNAFLDKPYTADQILQAVHSALAG